MPNPSHRLNTGLRLRTESSFSFWEWRRWELIQAALTGLLSDHLPHPEECKEGETCQQAVARAACEFADAVLERIKK